MVLRQKVILLVVVAVCSGEFFLPEITLEAYKPKGFRASIPGNAFLVLGIIRDIAQKSTILLIFNFM